jgi:hypothetical protein
MHEAANGSGLNAEQPPVPCLRSGYALPTARHRCQIAVLNAAERQNRSEPSVLPCDTPRTHLIRAEEPPISGKKKFYDALDILTSM